MFNVPLSSLSQKFFLFFFPPDIWVIVLFLDIGVLRDPTFPAKKKKIRKGHGRSTLNTYKMSRISSVGYPQIYTGGSYPLFLPYRGLL